MEPSNSSKTAIIWSLVEKIISQLVGFIISIVLARLLTPEDFGIVGITIIFITISNVFIEAGIGNALIRKIDRTEEDLSTALYFNVAMSIVLYTLLWVISPLIAYYFEENIIINLLRISGLNLIFGSFCIVQQSILTSQLEIKKQTIITLHSQIPAGILAIVLAFKGFGVYSLILQTVISTAIKSILYWTITRWRPKSICSLESLKYLWSFGSKMTGANLIGTVFDQIYSVLIGKYIGKSELGYFAKGQQLVNQIYSILNGMVLKIALPLLSKYQGDKCKLCEEYREIVRLLAFFGAFISSLLLSCSDQIVTLLWTSKWMDSSIIMKIIAVGMIFLPIGSLSLVLLQVVNRTDLLFKIELPKKAIYICVIFMGFRYGTVGLAVSVLIINMIGAIINTYATKKIIKYNYLEQLVDIGKYICVAIIASYVSHLVPLPYDSVLLSLIIVSVCTTILYLGAFILLHDEIIDKYIIKKIKTK